MACRPHYTYLYDCLDENKPIFGIFDIFRICDTHIGPLKIFENFEKRVIFENSRNFRFFQLFLVILADFSSCFGTQLGLKQVLNCFNTLKKGIRAIYCHGNYVPECSVRIYRRTESLYRVIKFTDTLLAKIRTPNIIYIWALFQYRYSGNF